MTITITGKMSIPRSRGRVRPRTRLRVAAAIGLLWMICGDSQTEGRVPGDGTSDNPGTAFRHIYNENFGTNVTTFTNLGQGGSSLNQTTGRYNASGARTNRTWVHSQESGAQDGDSGSQDTAAEFKAVFKTHIRAIFANTPGAIISYETPFSFGREGEGEGVRDWRLTYEIALREAIDELLLEDGIRVYLAEVRRNIEALQAYNEGGIDLTGADVVWYDNSGDNSSLWAHYTALGNFMVALSMMAGLGIDPRAFTFTSITDVTANEKTACLAIINRFAAADGLV
jgi:hypothetical protein